MIFGRDRGRCARLQQRRHVMYTYAPCESATIVSLQSAFRSVSQAERELERRLAGVSSYRLRASTLSDDGQPQVRASSATCWSNPFTLNSATTGRDPNGVNVKRSNPALAS